MLTPPRNYSGLDFKHSLPGHYVRPNVMCALRMEPWGTPHIKITVVRMTGPVAFRASTEHRPPRNILLDEAAPQSPVLGHELGHALGMLHIKALLGDRACVADDNAPRCYGETPQELANIMGTGRDLWPLNAAPWIDRTRASKQRRLRPHGRISRTNLKLKPTNINNVPRDVHHESQGGRLGVIGTRNAHIRA